VKSEGVMDDESGDDNRDELTREWGGESRHDWPVRVYFKLEVWGWLWVSRAPYSWWELGWDSLPLSKNPNSPQLFEARYLVSPQRKSRRR